MLAEKFFVIFTKLLNTKPLNKIYRGLEIKNDLIINPPAGG